MSDPAYTVRLADADDTDAFLALHETVFGTWPAERARAVFEWKYVDVPAVDWLPIVVAERDGRVVGARGYLALPLRVGGTELLGLQSADLMVHPDHRRQGLFTRMTEFGLAELGGPETLFFSFPAANAREGYLARGWTEVPTSQSVYCVDLGGESVGTPATARGFAKRRYQWLADRYVGLRTARARDDPAVTVTAPESHQASTLASLYDRHVPSGIHARRDRSLYEWRLSHPLYETQTYVARREGRVEAAVVVDTHETHASLREILPFYGGSEGVGALLRRVRADWTGVEALVAWPPPGHRQALRRAGFLPGGLTPYRSREPNVVVRPPPDGTAGGLPVEDPASWSLQLLERDW